MSTGLKVDTKEFERHLAIEDGMDRLRRYDRVQDRPERQLVNVTRKPGRNVPCICGSGRKFKSCYGGHIKTAPERI